MNIAGTVWLENESDFSLSCIHDRTSAEICMDSRMKTKELLRSHRILLAKGPDGGAVQVIAYSNFTV